MTAAGCLPISCQADKLGLEEATQLLQLQQAESELANFK